MTGQAVGVLAGSLTACGGDTADTSTTAIERLTDPVVDETRGLIRNTDRATPGYTMYGGLLSDTTYLIDDNGMVVHTWKSDYAPSGTAYLLDTGNILRGARQPEVEVFNGGGQGGRIQEITWDGEVVRALGTRRRPAVPLGRPAGIWPRRGR